MQAPLHTVVTTRPFERDAARSMSAAAIADLINYLAANPTAGDVIAGTGGARKLRWKLPARGKSGGVRVITFYSGTDLPVFLLACFAKKEEQT